MRTTLKIVLPLIVSVAAVSVLFAGYQVRTEKRVLRDDLSRRAEILGESLQESVEPLFKRGSERSLQHLVDRFSHREHLKGIAVYDLSGSASVITPGLDPRFAREPGAAEQAARGDQGRGEFWNGGGESLHIYGLPLHHDGQVTGTLALFHDATFIDAQVSHTLRDALLNALIQTLLISLIALVLVRWTFTDPLARMAKWLRTLRTGQHIGAALLPRGAALEELNSEMVHLARDLRAARNAAEEEARLRESNASLWTAERLRISLRKKLQESALFVVSNREPYMHIFNERDKCVDVIIPASGLVTAIEPVLRACNGTWVAHGSGSADREFVDTHDRLRVPPDHPSYTLRSATSRIRARFFDRATGWPTNRSIAASRTRCSTKCGAANHRSFWRRIITLHCCRGWSRKRDRMRGWPSSGTFRGPIRKCLGFARGNAK